MRPDSSDIPAAVLFLSFFFFLVERKVCFISDASNCDWGCVADICLKSDPPPPRDKQGVGAFIDRVWGGGGRVTCRNSIEISKSHLQIGLHWSD